MNDTHTLAAGLKEGVHESQQAFRAVLDALSRPGQIRTIGPALPDVALGGAVARLLLSLSDDETPIWWQCANAGQQSWLRFHSGAGLALSPQSASFAVVTDLSQGLALADFAPGSAAAPEFSCTLLIELPSLIEGPALAWRGPGIQSVQRVALQGLPEDFWSQWQVNQAGFPQGVDIVFTCGEQAVGLPRTTQVRPWTGV